MEFKDLKITTMTLIFELEGKIDLKVAAYLLPITKVNLNTDKVLAKYNVPLCNQGDIITLQLGPLIRGFIRKTCKRFFKNSIGVYMSTSTKNISFKISPTTFQLCGASSRQNGLEAATSIINHLTKINTFLSLIKNNKEEYQQAVDYLTENCKGSPIQKNEQDDYTLIKPLSIPTDLNWDIVHFLLRYTDDMFFYSDYVEKIKNISRCPFVFENKLELVNINEVMVNYNYNLGFRVDLTELDRLIYLRYGLYSYYDNALVNCVTVELPYQPELLEYKAKKAKKGIPHHTFLIYASGAVTQSGPCSSTQPGPCSYVMEDAYNIFRKSIEEIKDQIRI